MKMQKGVTSTRAISSVVIAIVVIVIIIVAAAGIYLATSSGGTTSGTTSTNSSSSQGVTNTGSSSGNGANVTVAMTVSQSGQYGPLDAGYLYFNQAWQAWVNQNGGLADANGQHHLVKVLTADDASSVSTADQQYHQFAEQQGANVLVSPYSADTGLTLQPIAQSDKVPLIMAEASTATMWNGTYTWQVTDMVPYWADDTTNAWSASYFQMLNSTHWAKNIAFIGWDITWAVDDYSSGLWLANHTTGLTVDYKQLLTPGTTTFTEQINALKALSPQPDIVYCAIFGPVCSLLIQQANQAGFHPKQWHTIEWGASFASSLKQATVSTDNITTDVFWTPSFPSSNPGTSTFETLMTNANSLANQANSTGNIAPVNWYDYQNIELRMIIFQMIAQAVSQTPSANFSSPASENSALNHALHHENFPTIAGQLTIQPQGYGTIALATVQWQHGDIETVAPQKVANATYAHP
jgi:ABC-type branched-subunit amino acid transport system substrate-binding protein